MRDGDIFFASRNAGVRMELALRLHQYPAAIDSHCVQSFYVNFIAQTPSFTFRRERALRIGEDLMRDLVARSRARGHRSEMVEHSKNFMTFFLILRKRMRF